MKKQNSKKIDVIAIFIPTILIALTISPKIKFIFLNVLPDFKEGTYKAGFVHAIATLITLCVMTFIIWILVIFFKKLKDKLIK